MHKNIDRILYSEKELSELTDRIASDIGRDYKDKEPFLIPILKGSVLFFADLVRKIPLDCRFDFMAAKSYGSGTTSSGNVVITKDITADISGIDVILVEDILDTGNTLFYIKNYLQKYKPASVKVCTLFDKPSRRKKDIDIKADYSGAKVDDLFIVGYGLDYDEKYRNLPYIGVLKQHIHEKEKE